MTEFDGSTNSTGSTFAPPAPPAPAVAVPVGPALDSSPASALEMLRERVEEREQEDVEPWIHEIKAIGVRLVCEPRIDNADYQRWMKASMPKTRGARRARAAGAMDLDSMALSARAIAGTNLRIEIRQRDGSTWTPITGGKDGDVLDIEHAEVLRAFNVMDAISLLRKLFGRDADLINAGQDLLAAAGYLDDEDDEDPS